MKVVVTGGHHNSALVVAEKLLQKGHKIYWFGHKYSMIGDENPSAEYQEVTRKGIPFIEIKAGKFQPKFKFLANLLRIPLGFWQSLLNLYRIKPDLIVSFGGYLALPVVVSSWLLGIPSVTHEQTTVSGLANKMIGWLSKRIFLTYPSSAKYFPKGKTVVVGLPLREDIFKKGQKIFKNSRKTIYITGGKQGAHVINEAVFAVLPELIKDFNVIHQCGSTTLYNDIKKAEQIKYSVGKKGKNYLVSEYFFDSEIGSVFYSADLVVSRAGAHTIYELWVLEKPAILVPIPWSSGHEQEKNAQMLENVGLAKVLSQEELNKGELLEEVRDFAKNLKNYQLLPSESKPRTDAADIMVSEIEKMLSPKH